MQCRLKIRNIRSLIKQANGDHKMAVPQTWIKMNFILQTRKLHSANQNVCVAHHNASWRAEIKAMKGNYSGHSTLVDLSLSGIKTVIGHSSNLQDGTCTRQLEPFWFTSSFKHKNMEVKKQQQQFFFSAKGINFKHSFRKQFLSISDATMSHCISYILMYSTFIPMPGWQCYFKTYLLTPQAFPTPYIINILLFDIWERMRLFLHYRCYRF